VIASLTSVVKMSLTCVAVQVLNSILPLPFIITPLANPEKLKTKEIV